MEIPKLPLVVEIPKIQLVVDSTSTAAGAFSPGVTDSSAGHAIWGSPRRMMRSRMKVRLDTSLEEDGIFLPSGAWPSRSVRSAPRRGCHPHLRRVASCPLRALQSTIRVPRPILWASQRRQRHLRSPVSLAIRRRHRAVPYPRSSTIKRGKLP